MGGADEYAPLRQTLFEAADLRMSHTAVTDPGTGSPMCPICGVPWPCDVRLCLDELVAFVDTELRRPRLRVLAGRGPGQVGYPPTPEPTTARPAAS